MTVTIVFFGYGSTSLGVPSFDTLEEGPSPGYLNSNKDNYKEIRITGQRGGGNARYKECCKRTRESN